MIRRLRTFTLWTGTMLSVLIAGAFVVSALRVVVIEMPGGPRLVIGGGGFVFLGDLIEFDCCIIYGHGVGVVLPHWNSWRFELWAPAFNIPLYAVFAAVAVPTLLVWRFWPKPVKPGHCRCGYDLTGNESGTCPECGQPFEPKGDMP